MEIVKQYASLIGLVGGALSTLLSLWVALAELPDVHANRAIDRWFSLNEARTIRTLSQAEADEWCVLHTRLWGLPCSTQS